MDEEGWKFFDPRTGTAREGRLTAESRHEASISFSTGDMMFPHHGNIELG
jgi:hypothetical protein